MLTAISLLFAGIHAKDEDINARDAKGYTRLHRAANDGNLDLVKNLLDKKENINAKSYLGQTPVYLAVARKRFNVVKYLVEKGANLNIGGKGGRFFPLHRAIRETDFKMIKLLVKGDAHLDVKDNRGSSVLLIAVGTGQLSIVNYFISLGADPTIKNKNGKTPRDIADKIYNDLNSLLDLTNKVLKPFSSNTAIRKAYRAKKWIWEDAYYANYGDSLPKIMMLPNDMIFGKNKTIRKNAALKNKKFIGSQLSLYKKISEALK